MLEPIAFTVVEQQIETNEKLAQLLGAFLDQNTTNLTDWLGKEVRHKGSSTYQGHRIEIGASVQSSTDQARLVVRDSNTNIVFAKSFDPSEKMVGWNGETNAGPIALNGRYSFEIEGYTDYELTGTKPGSVFDLVTEVRLDHGSTILVFADGSQMSAEDTDAIRIGPTS